MIESKNPYTGESIEKFEELSKEQIDEVLDNAQQRYKLWRKTTMSERAEFMNNAAEELKANKEEYARDITLEMGKPISQSISEI